MSKIVLQRFFIGVYILVASLMVVSSHHAYADSPVKTSVPAAGVQKKLAPGPYTARIKALACEGCKEFVEKTLSEFSGLQNPEVDLKSATVKFIVKPGAGVTQADLQKALDKSAGDMGMGADYTLLDLRQTSR